MELVKDGTKYIMQPTQQQVVHGIQPQLQSQNQAALRLSQQMGGKGDNGDDDMKWSDKNELVFLGILYDRVKKDPNGTPSFKSTDWQEMDEEMFLLSGERYGQLRLQGKFNRLRQKYRLFSELLEHTGVTYLSNSNTVNAPEDVWQMFFKKHKIYRTFRKKGCSNYEMLGQVFNKSTATGHLYHASTQLPPTSDEERQKEEEFLNHGVHVLESEKSTAGSSKGKHTVDENVPRCGRVRKPGSEKWDSCLELLAASLSARAEADVAKDKRYKGESTEATSQVLDPYSIDEVMDLLGSLDDISDASYIKAIDKFNNPYYRKIFVKMPSHRRNAWLKSLE